MTAGERFELKRRIDAAKRKRLMYAGVKRLRGRTDADVDRTLALAFPNTERRGTSERS